MAKDSGLRIRVERELREKFVELCRTQDRPAAQVIREFMRAYVQEHHASNEDEHQAFAKSVRGMKGGDGEH